jgi:membrane-associated phospholipid phosphatase
MQYGTFITIPVATIIALLFHGVRLAIELGVAGIAVYELAKLAKDAFPRGRPGAVLVDAHLRGVPAGQQGFPSGHAAVSAALAFILFAYLPGRWRWSHTRRRGPGTPPSRGRAG